MPEERLRPITSSSHLTPDDVARHTFASVRRGFDPAEVRAYLESVAAGLQGIADRERQLLDELGDAEHRAANPVLDEHTLTTALGTETARVLHSAHEVASDMTAKAQAESSRLLAEAQAESSRLLAESESESSRLLAEARHEIEQSRTATAAYLAERTAETEAAVLELRERTDQQIASGLDSARREADQLVAQAREECRAMIDEAQGLRARVLADMAKRRKVLHAQIEQLRAGRERLAETVHDVRRSIDVIADELFAAEDNARLAAEAAGREAVARPDDGTPEELAAELLADETVDTSPPTPGTPDEVDAPGAGRAPGDLFDVEEMEAADAGLAAVVAEEKGAPAAVMTAPPSDPGPEPATDDTLRTGAHAVGSEPVPGEKVDALFAKLRAASEVVAVAPAGSASSPTPAPPTAAPAPEAEADRAPAGGGTGPDEAGGEAEEDVRDEGPPEARSPETVQRDEMIAPVIKALSRRLKRTLQDNQNELLDQLRSKGTQWSMDLLPEITEHVDSYSTAVLSALEQASEAGVAFAGSGAAGGPTVDALLGVAHELADSVVGPLRRRLADGDGLAEAEESVVADHIGSAFREWKGERIERLAGDHVVAAFSLGTIAAVHKEPSARLEWVAVAGAGDAPCPDCEDNGLGGALSPGEEFPTGHRHPPAHSGCRCVLVIPAT